MEPRGDLLNSRRSEETRGDPRTPVEIRGGSRRSPETRGDPRRLAEFAETRGDPRRHAETRGDPRRPAETRGDSRRLVIPAKFFEFLYNCLEFLGIPSESFGIL